MSNYDIVSRLLRRKSIFAMRNARHSFT